MRITHISKIQPQYRFPEWEGLVKRGYHFYLGEWGKHEYQKVLLKIGRWIVYAKMKDKKV